MDLTDQCGDSSVFAKFASANDIFESSSKIFAEKTINKRVHSGVAVA